MNQQDHDIKARLNAAIDAGLGPRRPAPPFDAHAGRTVADRGRPFRSPWVLPMLAALVVGILTVGVVLAIRTGSHQADPARPTPPPPTVGLSGPAPTPSEPPSTSASATSTVPSTTEHSGQNAQPPASTTATTTTVVTIRPVTADGTVVGGFGKQESSTEVTCWGEASPVAVDSSIVACDPSLDRTACFGAGSLRVYCLNTDLTSVTGYSITRPLSGVAISSHPLPLVLKLANGSTCLYRTGGAGQGLAGHPHWAIGYFCDKTGTLMLWAPAGTTSTTYHPIDESSPEWTVQYGPATGPVSTQRVTTAYFVGRATAVATTSTCPTADGMLHVLADDVGGGPYQVALAAPNGYGCKNGWAFIVYNEVTPPTGRPNTVIGQDFRFTDGRWSRVSKQVACGSNLDGPMPQPLKQNGGCGG